MRHFIAIFLFFLLRNYTFSQSIDSCMLVGSYALNRLEMSQQVDSDSRSIAHKIRWSLYEQSGLSDTLIIDDYFKFNRKVNFLSHFDHQTKGQFSVQQDSLLTLFVRNGQLYTMPELDIVTITKDELVIVERFKSRWIRRSFRKSSS